MSEVELRPAAAEDFPAFYRVLCEAFNEEPREDDREVEQRVFEPERSIAAFEGKDIVATSASYTRTLTVPGALLPFAAVTLVSVAPAHRRRGLLTGMMRRQLAELHEGGEPVAALWASESVIYQRFGYGMASRGSILTVPTDTFALRPEVDLGAGRVRLCAPEEALPRLKAVHEAARQHRVGFLDRPGRWWDNRVSDPEHVRGGATPLRYAVYEEPDGRPAGYAMYRTKANWTDGRPTHQATVRELLGGTPQATAALWAYLGSLDLVRTVTQWQGPVDEPLLLLHADPRRVELSTLDQLWVRLADVGRALAGRRYAAEVDVVLEVADAFCPWNAGRWRLAGGPGGAACERTDAAADLALTSTELGSAYLGSVTLGALAAAGRVRELRAGALAAASAAFTGDRQAWTPEVF